jgi:lipid-A-disaccharide synthase
VQRDISKMLVIFPFEELFYREHGVEAQYVGHPLADVPPPVVSRYAYAQQHGLDLAKQWIALMPGSRTGELKRHMGTMLASAAALGSEYEYLLPRASTISAEQLKRAILQSQRSPLKVKIRTVDDARLALAHSRAAVIASGTATVEAALAGVPFVVVYRVAPLTWSLGRRMVRLPNFAMVNLIAGKTVVPELIQHDFTGARVLEELRPLLAEGEPRTRMIAELGAVRERLKPGSKPAADRAADAVIATIASKSR